MSAERDEPIWVPQIAVKAAHFDQLQEHGGERGLRQSGALLETALSRPRNKFSYETASDLADLAAAYAFAIAKSCHPFNDGNKRTAFVTAAIFLELNGFRLVYADRDVVDVIVGVADGSISEEQLAEWLRAGLQAPGAETPADSDDERDD